jgi:5-methyltetrahydrofolate--homocysteine methyltransferase
VIAGTRLKVIALCMSDDGMPETSEQRFETADKLINKLLQNNVKFENIYVDPLVQPISTNIMCGVEFIKAVEQIMTGFPGCHTICGLTNISYGLPQRKLLNRTFLPMAVAKGLDAVIIDPLDKQMRQSLYASQALAGHDDFCMEYIKAYRLKKLD